jgi:hypothetical protein
MSATNTVLRVRHSVAPHIKMAAFLREDALKSRNPTDPQSLIDRMEAIPEYSHIMYRWHVYLRDITKYLGGNISRVKDGRVVVGLRLDNARDFNPDGTPKTAGAPVTAPRVSSRRVVVPVKRGPGRPRKVQAA